MEDDSPQLAAALGQRTEEIAGYRTRVLDIEGEGPALLLFHGFSDSADTWRSVLRLAARRGRRTLALDLPGFGTASPLEPGLIVPQWTRFARAAVERLAPGERPLVAGNSLGGYVALRLAMDPELELERVVAIAPAGLHLPRWVALIERDPVVRFLLHSRLPLPSPLVRRAIGEVYRRLAFYRPRTIERSVVTTYASHVGTKEAVRRVFDTLQALLPELREPLELSGARCPVVLVWGDRDRLISRAGFERVLDVVPESRLVVLERCGHCPQIELPERLADVLLEPIRPVAQAA